MKDDKPHQANIDTGKQKPEGVNAFNPVPIRILKLQAGPGLTANMAAITIFLSVIYWILHREKDSESYPMHDS